MLTKTIITALRYTYVNAKIFRLDNGAGKMIYRIKVCGWYMADECSCERYGIGKISGFWDLSSNESHAGYCNSFGHSGTLQHARTSVSAMHIELHVH